MLKNLLRTATLLDRSERPQVLVVIILMLGSVLLETVGVALILPLVRILIDPSAVFSVPPLNYVYRSLEFNEPRRFLAACALTFLGVIVFKSAFNVVSVGYQERLCHRISSRVGARLIARYLRDPWSVQAHRNSADIINVADVMSGWPLTNALRGYPVLATEGLLSLALLGILLWVAPRPALFCIVVFGIALFITHGIVRRQLMALSLENAALGAARLQHLQESLASIKEITILGCADEFIDDYARARQRDASNLTRLLVWQNVPRALVEPMAVAAMTAAIFGITANPANDPPATAAVLGLFALAGIRLTPSLTRMLVAANSIRASSAPVERISADLAEPVMADVPATVTRVPQLSLEIRADNVTFRYARSPEPMIAQVSLTIAKGETVGLTGPSGSGKSTLADLLTGLLTPISGTIRVDGTDIAGDLKGWQRQIGYIPQTISLIDATLSENIALGVKARDIDMARMRDAIALAQLEGMAGKMSMDTKLGERGIKLSGGERQRIGIARALYHGRSVLVMDEATSALDGDTENEIGMALARLRGKYTILVIAHRLSTMRRCDRILILEAGRITASGSPQAMEDRFEDWGHLR